MRSQIQRQAAHALRCSRHIPAARLQSSTAPLQPSLRCAALRSISTTARLRTGEAPRPATDFGSLDVLGNTPAPSTSVDVCMHDGFGLNSNVTIRGGDGALLVSGEAFSWRPWAVRGDGQMTILNKKGQVEFSKEAFGVLDLLWPRPGTTPSPRPFLLARMQMQWLTEATDLLIIGVGKEIRPLSPDTSKMLASLGLRIDVMDTRNAAAQFNMLATERGVSDVAAALIPMGWKEGVGAALPEDHAKEQD
ncbi:NADH dehydrogenase [ubiquinone] 1 alpha subcomplex assembly factor-like protein [Emericellopsis cladophorae]|uniref:NADH dehydrogenase [ubiquinone] 1 alpha subcomplex assembly factor-like protein n=1 Tax=Emericellopsis cladophorae TaxID=2686198 RepID=A0A9Q0BH64_9HYPO|nr:NADH dehydrogenase [ubiquinone] 1 alpha subcomplex assembly factor-like protein [Emericellopsis cladophorae]KAI6784731.1 NADH dehydrogenase [ubiquinone] 1 alpha subcomplex assembly factor-like protein [Emericellopsis cladophorae]